MNPRVLLIGGHGKVSQFLTPLILSRSWQLTSLIRNPDQKPTITALGANQPGQLDVLVASLEEVKTQSQAQSIIDSSKPDYIVWSAGAGGKGGPERTKAIDQDACIAFIRAAASTKSVTKFILVSYPGARRRKAPWWGEAEWKKAEAVNNGALANYYKAKVTADEALVAWGRKRGKGFAAISLRPSTLADGTDEGKISFGKTRANGTVPRSDVARVAVELLENQNVGSCWLDLLSGDEPIKEAVAKVVNEGVDTVEGEDVDALIEQYTS